MSRDYSDAEDRYGISEYTAQSADRDVVGPRRKSGGDRDARGNSLTQPRGIPTQAEADAVG